MSAKKNDSLKDRAIQAADAFVTRRGYEVLDSKWEVPEEDISLDLVAKDCESDTLVFISIAARASGDSLPEENLDRSKLEIAAARWLAEHPEAGIDFTVRFDAIAMLVVGDDRALLRHHINVMGEAL